MLYALVLFAQEGAKPEGAPPWATFVPLVVLFAVFYFFVLLPQRRREAQQRESLNTSLKKNDEVVTSSGIIGTLVSIKDNEDEAVIRVDDNVRLRILKSSIVLNRSAVKDPVKEPPKT